MTPRRTREERDAEARRLADLLCALTDLSERGVEILLRAGGRVGVRPSGYSFSVRARTPAAVAAVAWVFRVRGVEPAVVTRDGGVFVRAVVADADTALAILRTPEVRPVRLHRVPAHAAIAAWRARTAAKVSS